jgi:hypothetical protein
MSSKDDRKPEEEEEEVGALDPRRGPLPTEAVLIELWRRNMIVKASEIVPSDDYARG